MRLPSSASSIYATWPTIGAQLQRPDVQQRIARRDWLSRSSRADHGVRSHVVVALGDLQRAAIRQRPLDHLADDLAWLAQQLRRRSTAVAHVDAIERPAPGLFGPDDTRPFADAA